MADTIYKSKYTGEQIESILDKASSLNPVSANPSESSTQELTKLKVDNVVYSIPEGTGGTNVVANPSESATQDLNKLKVGSVVYNVINSNPFSSTGGHQVNIKFDPYIYRTGLRALCSRVEFYNDSDQLVHIIEGFGLHIIRVPDHADGDVVKIVCNNVVFIMGRWKTNEEYNYIIGGRFVTFNDENYIPNNVVDYLPIIPLELLTITAKGD